MANNDRLPQVNRRKVLKMTSAATVGSTALTGAASANPGFLEPTERGKLQVNFCGCSSVCIGEMPNCDDATIVYKEGETEQVTDKNCYDRDEIIGVRNVDSDGTTVFYCNPNTKCSGNTASDCDEVGTAPQLEGGRGCGD